jgi:hypothetical protein
MRRRLIALGILLVTLISITLSTPAPATCAGDRCSTVKSLCMGQADMLNELCKATGGSPASCMNDFFQYYSSCMRDNGCN